MSLAASLFSPAQAKVLTWLFGQPERWYHVNELLRLTGLGSASLQRELKRLSAAGLLENEKVGNLRRIRANPQSTIYPEFVSVVQRALGAEPLLYTNAYFARRRADPSSFVSKVISQPTLLLIGSLERVS